MSNFDNYNICILNNKENIMNIIIINPDKENWDLRDQYSKINENIILNGIPSLEKNYNDYYTANEIGRIPH